MSSGLPVLTLDSILYPVQWDEPDRLVASLQLCQFRRAVSKYGAKVLTSSQKLPEGTTDASTKECRSSLKLKTSVSHRGSTASVCASLNHSPSIFVHDPGIGKHVDRESFAIQVIRHDVSNVPTTVSVSAIAHISPPQVSVTCPEQFGLYGPRGKSAIDQGSSRSELVIGLTQTPSGALVAVATTWSPVLGENDMRLVILRYDGCHRGLWIWFSSPLVATQQLGYLPGGWPIESGYSFCSLSFRPR